MSARSRQRKTAPPFLSLVHATFRLGERLVFKSTTWTLRRNEHWAIVGGNGSGKSLFADALRGRLPLIHGELKYHFRPEPGFTDEESIGVVAFEHRRAEVRGRVMQSRWESSEVAESLCVHDFLSYERVLDINPFDVSSSHRGAKRRFELRRRQAIRTLGVRRLLDRRLISLSNGETQKVQLARALCLPLRLLILDEPFIGLDIASRKSLHATLQKLMRGHLRVLILTSRPEDLPPTITHVLNLNDCRVTSSALRSSRDNEAHFDQPPHAGDRHQTMLPSRRVQTLPLSLGERAGERSPLPSSNRSNANILILLQNISVRYGRTTILDGLNWTVRAGENWALLGPNGSGKTTILSLISGDHPQAYGNNVTVLGHRRGDGHPISKTRHEIGWVSPEFQTYFDNNATCLEVVESGFHDTVGLFEKATRVQRQTALAWLKRFGLLPFRDHPLFELSAGLQRMVLLARALVKKPRLLLLDEPCQGLDAEHRVTFLQTLDRLLAEGRETAIYVTHRADEIPPSVKQVLRLANGQGHIEKLSPVQSQTSRRK